MFCLPINNGTNDQEPTLYLISIVLLKFVDLRHLSYVINSLIFVPEKD